MTREQQINDALALVAEAAKNGEILERAGGGKWRIPYDNPGVLLNHDVYEYKAKPRPREFWVCWDNCNSEAVKAAHAERPSYAKYYDNCIHVREVEK